MASNTDELDGIESSVNEAAGQIRAIWITFITFGAYLVIAVGSVTHRMLLLETPIKLPVLNVELPLIGFFVIAPLIFLVFHFYIFLQLLVLTRNVALYNDILASTLQVSADRRKRRGRLDLSIFVQLLAGGAEERTGLTSLLLRAIALITVVIAPILLLLQIELTFLPYHHEKVTWLHRIAISADLALAWLFWPAISSGAGQMRGLLLLRHPVMLFSSAIVVLFSVCIATYPGEGNYGNVISTMINRFEWIHVGGRYISISEALFSGLVNNVTGLPRSVFSNVLVVPTLDLIEAEKLDKVSRTVSLRGRDLRGAILWDTDLRKADFTGANLIEARLDRAKLSQAQFGCADPARERLLFASRTQPASPPIQWPDDGCTWLQGATFGDTQLQGAFLTKARLQGAIVMGARIEGASLDEAQLQGTILYDTSFVGASLKRAQLQGAWIFATKLHGASLEEAQMDGAHFFRTELSGASLKSVRLRAASLGTISLWRSHGRPAWAKHGLLAWRAHGKPASVSPEYAGDLDFEKQPFETGKFEIWRDNILNALPDEKVRKEVQERLSALDPARDAPVDVISKEEWNNMEKMSWNSHRWADPNKLRRELIIKLACARESAPFIARILIHVELLVNKRDLPQIIDTLKDNTVCLGSQSFSPSDLAQLDKIDPRKTSRTH
jgi:uncharacterized protein YjbI with pentapeptide repeats